ncbi:BON domain-containing protein [Stutzerimonas azotifigens]|uniref:BON domain-containing protein n=1 Tax=Stutzerimonas azotifigens TaxID=291995 RepID=A0ABR5Z445_9GAMM|nr:BON domain-containing protein [Stutzerimonas azotifigens]MBA1274976.1 BON domain-containing protein [Stutzerimonas azotifigens]
MNQRFGALAAALAASAWLTVAPGAQAQPAAAQDEALEHSVERALSESSSLRGHSLRAEVAGGHVLLLGDVSNGAEKELAERIARDVPGVSRVDNEIRIAADATADGQRSTGSTVSQRLDDGAITATVKSELLWNRETEGLDINVDTRDGVVTLTGRSQTEAGKAQAERLAKTTEAVRSVINQITVGGGPSTAGKAAAAADDVQASLSDAWITSKVKSALLYERDLDGLGISVDTREGRVVLSGKVESAEQRQRAIETARGIRGVRDVSAEQLQVN